MVSCKNCGNVFDEGFAVCPKCGIPYAPDAQTASQAGLYVPLQNEGQAKEKAAGKKKSKGKIIAIISIICAVIIGVIVTIIIIAVSGSNAAAREQISLGDKYMKSEEYDEAIIAFSKAIDIDPNNADAYEKLADAYMAVGNRNEAVNTLKLGYERTHSGNIKSKLDELSVKTGVDALIDGAVVKETGVCGDGLTYTLYDNGVTVVNGNGSIGDTDYDSVIWRSKKATEVFLSEGVASIGKYAFRDCDTITCIHVPRSVSNISEWAFNDSDRLTAINVDPDNNYYTSVDGVLYNKEKTILEAYPCGKWGTYVLPYTVTEVRNWALAGCMKLRYIGVENGSESFLGNDGVLFTKDGKTLVCYPAARSEHSGKYQVPDSVEMIGAHAFYSCDELTVIIIPESVIYADYHAFEKLNADQIIYIMGRQYIPYSWDSKWQYKCKAEIKFDETSKESSVPETVYNGW